MIPADVRDRSPKPWKDLERAMKNSKNQRLFTVVVETERTLVVRGANPVRAWCTRCAMEVDTVVLEAAGVLAQVDNSTIQQWLDAEELHAAQMGDGSARICLDSLLRSARRALPRP